ncbi:MAG: MotA/TolQ/ExbB proton channel family protein [Defluviitaleaceae bacterium]|nr:MotA/TolQ/ExbB proton channel family protein [Defluviitaleaceae bacterium]
MNILEQLIPPILDNLLGYDLLIIVMAVVTLVYFIYIMVHAKQVHKSLYTQGYQPDDVFDEEEQYIPPTKAGIKKQKLELREMRETAERHYSMFMNLTAIFPLMGILGTVISLIPLVQNVENMEQNFFVALTSTLWGLIFAVIFRLLDGVLLPRLELNNRGIDDYLEKLEGTLTEMKAESKDAKPEEKTKASVYDGVLTKVESQEAKESALEEAEANDNLSLTDKFAKAQANLAEIPNE